MAFVYLSSFKVDVQSAKVCTEQQQKKVKAQILYL